MKDIIRKVYYFFNYLVVLIMRRNVYIHISSEVKHPYMLTSPCKIGRNSYLAGSLGRYSYMGRNCAMNANVGSFCSIADNVKTVEGMHPLNFVSTSPAFYSTKGQTGDFFAKKEEFEEVSLLDTYPKVSVVIEDDVWIGENVLIRGGVTIGTGACIAMGAVVTKDVPPYAIVGGCPAKIIRKRFSEDECQVLLNSKWWLRDKKWLQDNAFAFKSIEEFIRISKFNC